MFQALEPELDRVVVLRFGGQPTTVAYTACNVDNGANTFFFKGTNGRWKDVLSVEELALYDEKAAQTRIREYTFAALGWGVLLFDPDLDGVNTRDEVLAGSDSGDGASVPDAPYGGGDLDGTWHFVRLEARRLDLRPSSEGAPSLGQTLRRGGPAFLIPVAVLIGLLLNWWYAIGFLLGAVVLWLPGLSIGAGRRG